MPIIGRRVFDEIEAEMVFCITGSVSRGKTRLAFDMARHYWLQGYSVYSNIPHNYRYIGDEQPYLLYKSFVVFDEGGEFVRTAAMSSTLTRSAGKAGYIAAFVGKRAPHKLLKKLEIEIGFDFYGVYGLPFQKWVLHVEAEKNYQVPFYQFLPQLMHGTYSTLTSAGALDELYRYAQKTVEDLAKREGQEAGKQSQAGLIGLADDLASFSG